MSNVGNRAAAAALALKPLGLHLFVSPPDQFVITDKPDEPETGQLFTSIEQVEAFIAQRQQAQVPMWRYDKPAPIPPRKLGAGDKVHYASHGSPVREDGSQAYPSVCRAAIVTEVPEHVENPQTLGLCVLNPTGMFFDRTVPFHPGTFTGPEREASPGEPLPLVTCDDLTFEGGTWHWISA
jgi:hypothetical protein